MEILQPHSGPVNKAKNLHFYRQIHSRKHKLFRIKEINKKNKTQTTKPPSLQAIRRERRNAGSLLKCLLLPSLTPFVVCRKFCCFSVGHQEQALPKLVSIPKLPCSSHPEYGSSTSSSALVSWNNLHPLAQALLFKKKWCLSGLQACDGRKGQMVDTASSCH